MDHPSTKLSISSREMFCLHVFSRCIARSQYSSTLMRSGELTKSSSVICPGSFWTLTLGSEIAFWCIQRILELFFALAYSACRVPCSLVLMRRSYHGDVRHWLTIALVNWHKLLRPGLTFALTCKWNSGNRSMSFTVGWRLSNLGTSERQCFDWYSFFATLHGCYRRILTLGWWKRIMQWGTARKIAVVKLQYDVSDFISKDQKRFLNILFLEVIRWTQLKCSLPNKTGTWGTVQPPKILWTGTYWTDIDFDDVFRLFLVYTTHRSFQIFTRQHILHFPGLFPVSTFLVSFLQSFQTCWAAHYRYGCSPVSSTPFSTIVPKHLCFHRM